MRMEQVLCSQNVFESGSIAEMHEKMRNMFRQFMIKTESVWKTMLRRKKTIADLK